VETVKGPPLKTSTDRQRHSNDHRRQFADIVRENQSMVFRVCYRILGNKQDAEDATQDVFVTFHRKAGDFRGEAKMSTWLYRIAVNASLNMVRKRRFVSFFDVFSLLNSDGDHTEYEPRSPDWYRPDKQFENKREQELLDKALAKLPASQRAAFTLKKFEGLSYQEIALILSTSLSSVESLIHRARKNLQKHLSTYFKER